MRRSTLAIVLVLLVFGTSWTSRTPARFRWRTYATAPSARTEVAAALNDRGDIVVAGGFDDSSRSTDTVEIYDVSDNSWTTGPPLPLAVDHVMGASLDGTVYVFGGYLADGSPSDRAFELRGSTWTPLPDMPEPRAAAGAAAAAGKIYVAGGIGANGLATSTLVFNPSGNGSWSTGPGLREPREHLGVAATGGRVYVLGGRAGGDLSDAAEVFNPKTGKWRRLPDMPTARGGVAAGDVSGGWVVVPGGEGSGSPDGTFPQVEALDTERERWVSLPDMPTPRHGLGVVGAGSLLYTLSGGPQAGFAFSGRVEAIDLRSLAQLRCLGLRPTYVGSPGRDVITGTEGRDVITGLGGADLVRGLGGGDLLCGGSGDDELIGGSGADRMDGGTGRDRCVTRPASREGCEL